MRTVRKGYLYDKLLHQHRRVLVDEHGFIFRPGDGWTAQRSAYMTLHLLPGKVEKIDWPSDTWWEKKNWSLPDWAWCYMFKSGHSYSEKLPKLP